MYTTSNSVLHMGEDRHLCISLLLLPSERKTKVDSETGTESYIFLHTLLHLLNCNTLPLCQTHHHAASSTIMVWWCAWQCNSRVVVYVAPNRWGHGASKCDVVYVAAQNFLYQSLNICYWTVGITAAVLELLTSSASSALMGSVTWLLLMKYGFL